MTQLDHQGRHTVQEENAGLNLQARVVELEARNLYLQSLVVELLDKNEQLRREARGQGKAADELLSQ
jgi:hypothetical protein